MEQVKTTVLIIEDDTQIRNFISYSLQKEKYQVLAAVDGGAGIAALREHHVDIILLDLGLPDIDGFEVIKRVRKNSNIPIIVVSARDQDAEKVEALDRGADDYLTKPFSVTELLARLRVSIRHLHMNQIGEQKNIFKVGKLKIDYEKHTVSLADEKIHLTPMEYDMLCLLSHNAGKIITTGTIIKELWGEHYGNDTRGLRTLMAGLRRKVEDIPAKPQYIITEVGIGYRMVDEIAK